MQTIVTTPRYGIVHDKNACAVWHEKAGVMGKSIGRPQVTVEDLPGVFLRLYPAYKSGHPNISKFSRVCGLSRTTIYKYISLLEV